MVLFFEWHQTAVDLKSSSGLPMTGEDTGLGALASPLAGYLGKVQERAASLEYCPWCASKGFTYALRSYHINLKESITLCTSPGCLFPLVTRPLEDVLSNLQPAVGSKRRNDCAVEEEDVIKPELKRQRASVVGVLGPQSVSDNLFSPDEHPVRTGRHATAETDDEKVHGNDQCCPDRRSIEWSSPQDEDDPAHADEPASPIRSASVGHPSDVLVTGDGDEPELSFSHGGLLISENASRHTSPSVPNGYPSQGFNRDISSTNINISLTQCSEQATRTEEKSQIAEVGVCKDTDGIKSEHEYLTSTLSGQSDELVSIPKQLFWSNSDSLCWLDSLLAALVNCKTLLKYKPKDEPQPSAVWQLMRGYENVCASIQGHQQTARERPRVHLRKEVQKANSESRNSELLVSDGVVKVPSHVLQTASADLQSLRMSVFKLLQPKLHCKLGQRETPVFAMPLLLEMDSWAERLFLSDFHWEFKCSECRATSKERLTKTLPSFTKIVPEWHPLHAVHFSPCNVCCKKNQRRTMLLERVPAVFALHFVEGLPDSDVGIYAFTFQGKRYSVTTVIQYKQQLRHFVTWISSSDGSWLEFDDLQYPDCKTHPKLQVPAHEMHVVFWEVADDAESSACSPSTTFAESPPPENDRIPSLNDTCLKADEALAPSPDQSLLLPHDDTSIVCALSEVSSDVMNATVSASADTSIGATTLLDTFEGLSHNDIITLTLVELNVGSQSHPLTESQQTEDLSVSSRNGNLDSTPDSSSPAVGTGVCHRADVGSPDMPLSSDTEAKHGSSTDPTFTPDSERGRGRPVGRRKPLTRQESKKEASFKVTSDHSSPPASLEPSRADSPTPVGPPAQDNIANVGIAQQTSPESSTETLSLSTTQQNPAVQSATGQNSRWSFLLSKHPLHQVQKSVAKLAHTQTPNQAAQVKTTRPIHSTPNPLKRQPIPAGLPKLKLMTEESEGLPLKAAEMYGGFGTKSLNSQTSLPSPALVSAQSKLQHPVTFNQPGNTQVLSGTSPPTVGVKQLPEICSSKKRASQFSKVPLGLSDTEALRYKLIKKLKAKKKKLAKLNQILNNQGGARLRPDSTDLNSPSTVSSSTYDGSTCDDFLSDLLSPATTASNLSPDSTGFFEMITNGQSVADRLDHVVSDAVAVSQNKCGTNGHESENFLEDFLSQCCGFD